MRAIRNRDDAHRAFARLVAALPLAAAGGAALFLAAACGDSLDEPAVVGEVHGEPLRAPSKSTAKDEAATSTPAVPPAAASESAAPPPDYAALLPAGVAKDYRWLDFALLKSFQYPGVERGAEPPEIPEAVRALDGLRVGLEGFMNPLEFDSGGVAEFSLVADPSQCCFGAVPQLNHFVDVTMPGDERTEFRSLVPIAAFGRLHVGAVLEDGIVLSLYRMEAEHVVSLY